MRIEDLDINITSGPGSFEEKLEWTLDYKFFHFMQVVEQFYLKTDGKVYLAFSGGKDSTLMVALCDWLCNKMGWSEFPLVFNNTTNEYQEILEFVKSYGDRVTWLRPKMTFAQSLEKNGYPLVSKEQAQRISEARNTKSEYLRNLRLNGVVRTSKSTGKDYVSGKISEKWKYLVYEDVEVTSKCCDILKKAPVAKFEKETGLHPIIGVTASESNLRKQQYVKAGGCNDFTGKRFKCKPLSLFTEEDVWALIGKLNIPICSIYFDKEIDGQIVQGEKRTGCAYCAFGVHFEDPDNTKFHRLQKREPKRWASMMDKLGYRKALYKVGLAFNGFDPEIVHQYSLAKVEEILEEIKETNPQSFEFFMNQEGEAQEVARRLASEGYKVMFLSNLEIIILNP